jgi:phytoene dehydrogenase-like protein
MQQVSLALAAKLKDLGGSVRTSTSATRIEVDGSRATAVLLGSGERIETGLVASSVDPAQLALRLLGADVIGDDAANRIRRLEWGDSVLVIYTALDGPVEYASGSEPGSAAHVHLSPPSLASMATATDQCRAGLLPEEPVIVSWNDSTIDPTRVPEGRHLKKFVVLGVPYEIRGDATGRVGLGPWEVVRERYADYIIGMLGDRYLPELGRRIIGRAVHSPIDIERKLSSAVRGTISHGAMIPYQAGPLRPTPDFAAYRSPVENVYLCGSGSHPGAGVSMAAGRNAASLILGDLGHPLDV